MENQSLQIVSLRSGMEQQTDKGLNIRLRGGQHLALSGRSGSGKSSLLRVLAGLQPAQSGHFLWQQAVIQPENLRWWRQQFCYLPQSPVMGAETLGEAIRLPWKLKAANGGRPDDDTCHDCLRLLDLLHDLDKAVAELSGGEQQRVAIVRALLMERPLWLMDEPTSALDHTSRDKVMAVLAAKPLTCVSVSHDPHWLNSADQIVDMDASHG
ncbi:ATP-binding cassette domain-containing protein [Photobacterium galatheae]|uniref:ABC transporter n=1 Tax=Photobacterium galatheae TaxID=1654360 RepID=A0A066RHH3_9GAMM|nr:ATP-binding cassette domain-containing protein [Photobacterium galatheae]KDM89749.1 ABC transporter [Photobacterium galatheae]MCM0150375.1 ATP-binding cassette domain-containing protein [Photobacterium galatheae]